MKKLMIITLVAGTLGFGSAAFARSTTLDDPAKGSVTDTATDTGTRTDTRTDVATTASDTTQPPSGNSTY
jgi:hypothetical protein